jgi:predicted ester cyclase
MSTEENKAIVRSHTAFPDLHVTIEAQIAEADLVATRWRAHGTQRGMLGNFPPTGKRSP